MHRITKELTQFLFGDIKDHFNNRSTFSRREPRGSKDFVEVSCLSCNFDTKMYSFLVTLSLTIVFANALSTEEQVRSFFRPEHRDLLPEVTSLQLRDEPALKVPQNDDSTKCLAHCEPQCDNVKVPQYLTVNIHIRYGFALLVLNSLLSSMRCNRAAPHLVNYDLQSTLLLPPKLI